MQLTVIGGPLQVASLGRICVAGNSQTHLVKFVAASTGSDVPGASAVVNIASVAGINGGGSSVAYAASKGALITMTKSLGRALAPSIRVNAVCPGYIDTPWFSKGRGQEAADKLREQVKGRVPLKLASKPENIAEAVVFLASPASGHMTGEAVRMDAGMHLGGG